MDSALKLNHANELLHNKNVDYLELNYAICLNWKSDQDRRKE